MKCCPSVHLRCACHALSSACGQRNPPWVTALVGYVTGEGHIVVIVRRLLRRGALRHRAPLVIVGVV